MRFQKRSVRRIARKGYLVKAMLRCFCLPAKRCLWRDEPAAAMCLRVIFAFAVTLSSTVIFALWASYSSLKRREFDGFLGFFAGSENPSVLSVHEFSGSAKTPKRRELSPFCFTKKISAEPASAHLAGSPK